MLVLRLTVLTWWTIPLDDEKMATSLAPNLYAGDLVLLMRGTPKYGDLVRCADPDAPGRYVVGRLLAEPGDTIELTNTDIVVNNRPSVLEMSCTEKAVPVANPTSGSAEELLCQIEAIQGHKHMRAVRGTAPRLTIGKRMVSEGNVFLVSDNRVYPVDSREYGAIPKASCREQVFFRIKGQKGLGDADSRFTYIRLHRRRVSASFSVRAGNFRRRRPSHEPGR